MFTMCLNIVWIWIDEITDIIFILFIINNSFKIQQKHDTHFILYLYIGCISFNHFCNFILSIIIRNNWCNDKGVIKQYQYLYHKTIPKTIKFISLIFVGILNVAAFNTICKTYYLLKNKNNVGTIYIDQRFPCSGTPSSSSDNNKDRRSTSKSKSNDINNNNNNNNNNISKNERLQKWYNKLYDMEALSIKEMFNAMLEKEAQIYPLLILCQFFETIPKLIVYGLLTGWVEQKNHHPFIVCKLIMSVLSFVSEIKSCFISCANAEFIEQFTDE